MIRFDHTRATKRKQFCQLKAVRVCDAPVSPATRPEDLIGLWHAHVATCDWYDPDKEALVVFLLNTRLKAFAWNLVSLGSLDQTVAHPREILRPALMAASHGIALMHNHPAGDPAPSTADRSFTRRLREACEIMQIKLIDHVIIGQPDGDTPGHFSFRESGMI